MKYTVPLIGLGALAIAGNGDKPAECLKKNPVELDTVGIKK